MKHSIKITTVLFLTIFLSSCAKVFFSSDAYTLANDQKIFAILPPTVSIAAKRNVDPASLNEQQKTESVNIQNEMFSWILARKSQGKIVQEVQDLNTTNTLLARAGYPEKSLTNEELCTTLGVDGIMSSNFRMSKPMSLGGAVALALVFGVGMATNEVQTSLTITDCKNKKMIWNYNHTYSGGIGSSPSRLVDALMRNASKKMPYVIRRN